MPRKLTQQALAGIFVSALLLAGLAFGAKVDVGGSTTGTGPSVSGVGAPSVTGAVGPSAALFNSPYYSCTTNRYVSTTGSDSNNGTAADNAHAWLTIAHADTVAPSAGWCINVLPGTYTAGSTITHGGNTASSTGYVVYRCTTLNGCNINGDTSQTFQSTFGVVANYVMIDGFSIDGNAATGTNTNGITSGCTGTPVGGCGGGGSQANPGAHHIWILNNIITRFGQSGAQLNQGEYIYTIHNKIFDTGHDCDIGVQGSNISYYLPIAIPSYTPTADDGNNPVTGNTGSLFHQFIMWNIVYNSYICSASTVGVTDGNGIILDDWYGDQFATCVSGSPATGGCAYVKGGLVAFNVSYNNGSYGVHPFASSYAVVANNSVFNNNLQLGNTNQSFRAGIDDNGSYGITVINNISYTGCGSGAQAFNSAIGAYNTQGNAGSTTLNMAGGLTAGATSITVTSAATFPGGATFNTTLSWNGTNALPGGNLIKIDSEILYVTAGWTTTTWTATRGYNGTTAASHSNGATVTWIQNYWSNNITHTTSTCTEIDIEGGNTAGTFYSATANKEATLPGWVDVGNTSFGTDSVQPVGANFALVPGSPAIGYGQAQTWLPAQSADAGACPHNLTSCP